MMKGLGISLLALLLLWGCGSNNNTSSIEPDSGSDGDTDSDSDSDSDTDTDTGESCTQPEAAPHCSDGWCRIEPGCFIFGSPYGEPCRGAYNEKQVQVTLTRPFVMSETEVTQQQWEAMGFPNPARDIDPDKPVTWINWYEALAYANALSEAEGLEKCYLLGDCVGTIGSGCPEDDPFYDYGCRLVQEGYEILPEIYRCESVSHLAEDWATCNGYRLPTVAESEYAVRAGTTTSTYIGEITTDNNSCKPEPAADPIAWSLCNTGGEPPAEDVEYRPRKVCQREKNGWGLCDKLGNAGEHIDYIFTGASLETNEGKEGPLVNPQGLNPDNPESSFRGNAGGSAHWYPCQCRAAKHHGNKAAGRDCSSGFRLVRTVSVGARPSE